MLLRCTELIAGDSPCMDFHSNVPAIVDEGCESEKHLVTARYVPQRAHKTQIDQVALSEISA